MCNSMFNKRNYKIEERYKTRKLSSTAVADFWLQKSSFKTHVHKREKVYSSDKFFRNVDMLGPSACPSEDINKSNVGHSFL